ncbi:unnamed protein product [Caretta caretta]
MEQDATRRTSSIVSTAQDPDDGYCPAVQDGTSAGWTSLSSETSLPSETTQWDLNTSLDTCSAKPLHTTLPDQEEPSSESTDTAEAHPTEGEERENDCIYLQYPLPTDILLCPFCYPVRGFQYIGGLSRHLKRIHSKRITFRCALCNLPFEMQKKCKTHQVTCKGYLAPEESNSTSLCC